ncbi:MAG: Uma2 family endonuclease [Jatrophihabitantaceae bacterium]
MAAELTIGLPSSDGWTWDDLQAVPDDRYHYYQLIEGQILMSPSPNLAHQTCVVNLLVLLKKTVPREFHVLVAPFDFVPEPTTSLQPDVLVLRRGAAEKNRTVVPPLLAIEVLSPRTRTFDLTAKRALYERFGVQHYWLVDPAEPSVLALELGEDGNFFEAASVSGDDTFEVSAPFAVEFTPSALVAD